MKKKLLITLLAIIASLTCALAFTACGGGINGTYYQVKYDGTLDESIYYKLDSGNWEDDDGVKGTYKTDGNKIRLYVELFGENETLADGTVENGVLSIDIGAGIKEIYVTKDHKHEYGEWQTVNVATCTIDGVRTRTCACGVTERDVTPSLGHSGEWETTKDATCTEEGIKEIHCTVCGEEETQTIDKLPHNYSDWSITKETTCTEEGNQIRTCSVCGKVDSQVIETTPHIYETNYGFNADNHWQICKVCENEFAMAEHDNKDNCSICGYPFRFTLSYNTYNLDYISFSYINEEVIIPSTFNNLPVTSISDSAFYNRSSIESISIPDSVTYIGESMFSSCSSLKQLTVSTDNSLYSSQDGILYNKTKTYFICIPNCLSGDITIPDTITSINNSMFYNRTLLTGVTISNSITSIPSYAFEYCSSLINVTIPNSVTSIGQYAFNNCTALTSLTIPDSVTSISQYAFANCSSLTSVTIPDSVTSISKDVFMNCTSLTSVTIPNSVTSISESAFWGCASLTSITLPNIVTSINSYAFYKCTSLTSITFEGTVEQWTAITKGDWWSNSTGNYTIHCTDGEIAKDGTVTMY